MQQSELPALSDLEAFVALAESGTFASAALRIGRDATILSRRVRALERCVGVRLADRTTRRVTLTEAGRIYLDQVRPMLQHLERAGREIAAYGEGEPQGRLRLALPTSFGRLWLAPSIVAFATAFPKVSIDAHYTDRVVDLVAEGFDAAVRLASLPDSSLVARKLADRRRLICAAPHYLDQHAPILEPGDIVGHPCLCFTGRRDWRRWQFVGADTQAREIEVLSRMTSDDAELLVEGALAGLGLLMTTDWHVGHHLAAGRLELVLPEWSIPDSGAIYLLTPPAGGMPPKTRAFSDWLAKGLAPPPWR